jgi:uncharacterized protein YfaP (DUF2135 family)
LSAVTNQTTWTLTGSVADSQSGVALVELLIADQPAVPVAFSGGQFSLSFNLVEGTTAGLIRVTDAVGLSSEQAFALVSDRTAPQLTLLQGQDVLVDPARRVTNSANQTIEFTASDALSGVAELAVQLNGEALAADLTQVAFDLSLVSGDNELVVVLTDGAGNSVEQRVTFVLDQSPPNLSWTGSDQATAASAYTLAWTAQDNLQLASQRVTTASGQSLTVSGSGPDYTAQALLVEGLNHFSLTAVDSAGNESQISLTKLADFSAPQFSQWSVPSLTRAQTIDVSALVTDTYSSVADLGLTVNGAAAIVERTDSDQGTLLTATLALQEANNSLLFSATDVLGNRATVTLTVNRDSIAPQLSLNPPATLWQANPSFTLAGTIRDENSGIASANLVTAGASLPLALNDGSFSQVLNLSAGLNSLELNATDVAGNQGSASLQVGWDNSPPSILLEQAHNQTVNSSTISFSGSVSDADSGIATLLLVYAGIERAIELTNNRFAISLPVNEGQSQGQWRVTDRVGRQTLLDVSVISDVTAPVLQLSYQANNLAEGDTLFTALTTLALDLTTSDSGTGVANLTAELNGTVLTPDSPNGPLSLSLVEGRNSLQVRVSDLAGNQSSLSIRLVLDQAPPTLAWLSSTEATNNPAYRARWTATEATGLATQQISLNGTSQTVLAVGAGYEAEVSLSEGANTLVLNATDLAGNRQTLAQSIQLDTTAPVLSIAAVEPKTAATTLTLSGSVQDASALLLTLDGQPIPVDAQGQFSVAVTLNPGNNRFNLRASDALANATQQSVTLISDQIGPVIQVTLPAEVEDELITLVGTVTDALSAVTGVTVLNETTGVPYAAVLNDDQFSADLILQAGSNQIVISATDALNNSSSTRVQTEFDQVGLHWQWLSHTNNSELTDATVVLEGLLTTEIPPEDLRITLGGQPASLSLWSTGVYSVKSAPLALTMADNRIRFDAIAPTSELHESIRLVRVAVGNSDPTVRAELVVDRPVNNAQLNGDYLLVSGSVKADTRPVVTLNGVPVSLATSVPYYYFSETLAVPANQSAFTVTLVATLADQSSLTQTRTVQLDSGAPTLNLTTNLLPYPSVTYVLEDPFVLSGTVSDSNFSSLTLNGQVVPVEPAGQNTYAFSAAVALANGVESSLQLSAQDAAGNSTRQTFVVQADRSLNLSWLLPLDNSQFLTYGDAFPVQVVVQSSETNSNHRYQVRLVDSATGSAGTWQNMTFGNRTGVTELQFAGSAGTFNIEARVIDTNNVTVAALQPRTVSVSEPAQVPLALVTVQPAQGAQRVDTKAQIALFFNQSIDASQLEVTVFETVFGKTWLTQDAQGTEAVNA